MDPIVGAVLAAIVAGLASYLAAARKLSGKINTSDAAELWTESRSIREWSAERISALSTQVSELEHRIEVVEGYNLALVNEKQQLLQQIQEHMAALAASRETVATLTNQLNIENARNRELEEDIKALQGKRRHETNGE